MQTRRDILKQEGISDAAPSPPSQVWSSAVSCGFEQMEEGLRDSIDRNKKQLGDNKPDIAVVFISSRYLEARGRSVPVSRQQLNSVVPLIQKELGAKHVIACTASGEVSLLQALARKSVLENLLRGKVLLACLGDKRNPWSSVRSCRRLGHV